MISSSQPGAKAVHHLARFVTREAIALLLHLKPEQIYRIDCWKFVIHVVGQGVSIFVSYADLPPIVGVEPPSSKDFLSWRKRWKKNQNQAPAFWVEFYAQKFKTVPTLLEMKNWGRLVGVIKLVLPEVAGQWRRSIFQEKYAIKNF